MCISSRRSETLLNLLVGVLCGLALVALILPMIGVPRRRTHNMLVRDATQMRSIHQAWLTFSNEFNGILPTPGLVKRLPLNGAYEPGRGLEDVSQNTTANLYSLCIMNHYFTPDVCVGMTEPSANVLVHDTYNFEAYAPATGVCWDPKFRADLHDVSHVSYAHQPISGGFKIKAWKNTGDANIVLLGTRGPLNGVHDPKSMTNQIFPPDDRWNGFVCYNDGSAAMYDTFAPKGDNIFAFDRPESDLDIMLTFTKAITAEGPVIEHD